MVGPGSVREAFKPLVFVVMPYGTRAHPDTGLRFEFDRIYQEVVAPAALAAGCQVIRSDHEEFGGVVHTSMFERLLLARRGQGQGRRRPAGRRVRREP